jgi:hypothetical protein
MSNESCGTIRCQTRFFIGERILLLHLGDVCLCSLQFSFSVQKSGWMEYRQKLYTSTDYIVSHKLKEFTRESKEFTRESKEFTSLDTCLLLLRSRRKISNESRHVSSPAAQQKENLEGVSTQISKAFTKNLE